MISFIVIGKNEGWRLTKCIESIYNVIANDNISEWEIIYVDSKSTDDSIERSARFKDVKVFLITGDCNAAIARNIGAREANRDILFFIDGDMEISSGFLSQVILNGQLCYPFLSGVFIDYNYNSAYEFIKKSERFQIDQNGESYENITGGLFIIERNKWELVIGMDNRLKRNQDLDLGLRMTNKGYPLLRKGFILAKHNTIEYTSDNRFFDSIINTKYAAILSRKHFFNKSYYKLFIRTQYTAIALVLSLFFIFITFIPFLFFPFVIGLRIYKTSKKGLSLKKSIVYILGRDLVFIFSFLFFWPNYPIVKYKAIN